MELMRKQKLYVSFHLEYPVGLKYLLLSVSYPVKLLQILEMLEFLRDF